MAGTLNKIEVKEQDGKRKYSPSLLGSRSDCACASSHPAFFITESAILKSIIGGM
jgi:hypothetical protein